MGLIINIPLSLAGKRSLSDRTRPTYLLSRIITEKRKTSIVPQPYFAHRMIGVKLYSSIKSAVKFPVPVFHRNICRNGYCIISPVHERRRIYGFYRKDTHQKPSRYILRSSDSSAVFGVFPVLKRIRIVPIRVVGGSLGKYNLIS